MNSRLLKLGSLTFIVFAIVLASLSCSAEQPQNPEQPEQPAIAAPAATQVPAPASAPAAAPAAQQQPAPAATARPAVAQAAPVFAQVPVLVPSIAGQREAPATPTPAPIGAWTEDYEYVAKNIPPGGYPSYIWDGPIPTKLTESPMSAALVRAGQLMPLEQRIPTGDDTLVFPPTQEIGVYGGIIRQTTRVVGSIYSANGFILIDADQFGRIPFLAKSYELSEDGRVYTFKIRKGLRWGDGYPLTMEDVRFAIEDMALNPDLVGLPLYFESPITGTPMEFKVVDDTTFTLTYADPFYTLMESRDGPRFMLVTRCPRCTYAPAHYMKRYHIKYNEKEITETLLEEHQQPTWQKLLSKAGKLRGLNWLPEDDILATQIPKEYDPDYIYRGDMYFPYPGGLLKTLTKDNELHATRNHYFPGVDPEGNQLPYTDGMVIYATGSRDTAVFRSMNGETDLDGNSMVLQELPLYVANMEKGDYSINRYFSPGGTDASIAVTQEYVEDPEIGALTRTTDFRRALSLAWDRIAANETVFAGTGVPNNWVPHPATKYFPGAEYATLDIEHDPDAARALMKKLGYEDRDGDGYVDRKDGSGPLELFMQAASGNQLFLMAELLQSNWKDIGIKLNIKDGGGAKGIREGTEYFEFHRDMYAVNPWFVNWTRLGPFVVDNVIGPQMGKYVATRGMEGMAPTGPDPKRTDAYGNMAPIGTYPADITGNVKKLQELYKGATTISEHNPKRVEVGKEIFRITAEEKYNIGGLGFAGPTRGVRFRRNNFRNVPVNHYAFSTETVWETLYFEDGIDNVNHPGNRSKRYKSISFMDPEYYEQR